MEKQNVTLSIPKHLLQKAKILAVRHNNSLSGLLTELLISMVESEDRYAEAKERSLARLDVAPALHGDYAWSRESLHER
jgi:hypothetical protein